MDTRVHAMLARGDGLVSAAELRTAGFSPRVVARAVRVGELVPVRRGVYTSRELWESWDAYAQRPLAVIRAAGRAIEVTHAFSHDSAAIVHGIPLLRPQDSDVHLTRPDTRASEKRAGIHHHGARISVGERTSVQGLPVLAIPRTVADLARQHGYRAGLVAADGALQRGVSRARLARAVEQMAGWPDVTTVRAVVADADPGAESAAETLARELLAEAGFTSMETQFPVQIPSGVAYCDIRVGCHLIEVDGEIKYRDGVLEPHRRADDVVREERARQREICDRHPLGMTRLRWADFWGRARTEAIERLRSEYRITERRFGSQLPAYLEKFADRWRGRRYHAA